MGELSWSSAPGSGGLTELDRFFGGDFFKKDMATTWNEISKNWMGFGRILSGSQLTQGLPEGIQ